MFIQAMDVINYNKSFLTQDEANQLFEYLMRLHDLTRLSVIETFTGETLRQDTGKLMFLDKELIDNNLFAQSLCGNSMPWSEEILSLKRRIEEYTNHQFGVCVCIYYPDGNSGVSYHSDLIAYGDTSIIPSLSLGEERQFDLREKSTMKESSLVLEHGSLLTMKNGCQKHYEHRLPLNSKYKNPRINLTFRKYGFDNEATPKV